MKYIELKKINLIGNRCEYEFDYPNEFEPYIADKNQKLFVELPLGFDLQSVPQEILAISFVGCILPVTLLLGIGIRVPIIDKTFFECIPDIKAAFKKMFPYADFCFEVLAKSTVDCSYEKTENTSVFFTGGVDATSALIETLSEKPTLINIWGGDLLLTDTAGRTALEKYISRLATQLDLRYIISKSNCRRFFNENNLEKCLGQIIHTEDNHGWWASIAHIISMISSIAPVLYSLKVGTHYIGSTYPERSHAFDSNNVDVINSIRLPGCRLKMVDEELCRSDKVRKIVRYSKENNQKIELKVCWFSTASENCSRCEKCYRTIAEILSSHADPNDYGFKIDTKGYRLMKRYIKYNFVNLGFWSANQEAFLKECDYWKNNKDVSWFLTIDFNNEKRIARYRQMAYFKSLLAGILHKLTGHNNSKP